jgi:hypothetical protein
LLLSLYEAIERDASPARRPGVTGETGLSRTAVEPAVTWWLWRAARALYGEGVDSNSNTGIEPDACIDSKARHCCQKVHCS